MTIVLRASGILFAEPEISLFHRAKIGENLKITFFVEMHRFDETSVSTRGKFTATLRELIFAVFGQNAKLNSLFTPKMTELQN